MPQSSRVLRSRRLEDSHVRRFASSSRLNSLSTLLGRSTPLCEPRRQQTCPLTVHQHYYEQPSDDRLRIDEEWHFRILIISIPLEPSPHSEHYRRGPGARGEDDTQCAFVRKALSWLRALKMFKAHPRSETVMATHRQVCKLLERIVGRSIPQSYHRPINQTPSVISPHSNFGR